MKFKKFKCNILHVGLSPPNVLQDVTHGLSIPAPLHCRARPGPGRSRASRSSPQRSPVLPQRGCPGPTTSGAALCRWNRHPQRRGKCPRGPRGGRRGRATAATQVPPGPCGPSAGVPGGGGCASSCRAGALRRDPRDPGPARPAPPGAPPAARGEPSCGRRWQPAASPGPRPAPARWAGTATAHVQVGRNTCQSQQQNISIGWGPAALSVHLAELRCRHRRCSPSRPSPSARKYSPRHGGAPAALPSPRSAFPGAATRVPVPRSPHIAASPPPAPRCLCGRRSDTAGAGRAAASREGVRGEAAEAGAGGEPPSLLLPPPRGELCRDRGAGGRNSGGRRSGSGGPGGGSSSSSCSVRARPDAGRGRGAGRGARAARCGAIRAASLHCIRRRRRTIGAAAAPGPGRRGRPRPRRDPRHPSCASPAPGAPGLEQDCHC
ncbi:uncharacterized protein GJ701_015351 [Geothlypis trichas]